MGPFSDTEHFRMSGSLPEAEVKKGLCFFAFEEPLNGEDWRISRTLQIGVICFHRGDLQGLHLKERRTQFSLAVGSGSHNSAEAEPWALGGICLVIRIQADCERY